MQRSVGKITDENVLLFSSQTKFELQKAAIIPFNADNHVISSCGRKKSLYTSVPISHVETLVILFILFFNIRYEQNCDISNLLKYFSWDSEGRAVSLVSVSEERSGSGKWWTRSGAGAEWLNARSAEGKLLVLHSAHIGYSAGHRHTNVAFC